jgi:hypothetical protein
VLLQVLDLSCNPEALLPAAKQQLYSLYSHHEQCKAAGTDCIVNVAGLQFHRDRQSDDEVPLYQEKPRAASSSINTTPFIRESTKTAACGDRCRSATRSPQQLLVARSAAASPGMQRQLLQHHMQQ